MSNRSSKQWRRASVTIDPAALAHNLERVREFAPDSRVMAVIKANGYGHGMHAVSEYLSEADMFAVAMPEEAFALRANGCNKPVLVIHGFSDRTELTHFSELDLATVVHQKQQLDIIVNSALSRPVDVWLKIDTGMHRLGITVDEVADAYARLNASENVGQICLMTHFANADVINNTLNNNQIESFIKVNNNLSACASMANSAAIISLPESHFDVVRPGIMLYGSSPFADRTADDLELKPAMQFEAPLIDIKQVKAGGAVGYGSTFTAEHDMRIGVVAAGYGDGYPRHAENGTPVWLNGRCCGLVGRVSMDSICIELADLDAEIGDRVVLWGQELSVDRVAACSGTISYELLCHAGTAFLANRELANR